MKNRTKKSNFANLVLRKEYCFKEYFCTFVKYVGGH